MALLEQLRPNLSALPYEKGLQLFTEYWYSREKDLQEVIVVKLKNTKKKVKKDKEITMSLKNVEILRKLGLI
ncbi:MAG: hypothetical protein ACTSQA_00620 [Candidatus Heimdallarchaeaceae archaeon]